VATACRSPLGELVASRREPFADSTDKYPKMMAGGPA
jgi:hypothetical protein